MTDIPLDDFEKRLERLVGGRGRRGEPDALDRALSAFYRGAYRRCLDALARAEPGPRVSALREAASALLAGRPQLGVRPCFEAIRQGASGPDLYAVLVTLLLASGDRARAHRVLREGLRRAPGHPVLRRQMEAMGVRKPPVVGFLPRSHPVNRWLGRVRHRYRGAHA
ncbi:MAG: hypothetical protein GXP50_11145 [Deltaproteobacteria bacterium]|nr:hypothetical protein [Deltaproteobacteria bacterium]